jgi:hypothetical protein
MGDGRNALCHGWVSIEQDLPEILIHNATTGQLPAGGVSAFWCRCETEHFPMSKINEAFARLEASKARYRIVLDADF